MNQSNALKKKPRGAPFAAGADARRNAHGQRNAAAVALSAELRKLYLQVLAEPANQSETERERNCDKLELIVRRHVQAAAGNDRARETLFDRIWGKSAATEGHEFDALSDAEIIQRAETVRLKLL
jgi:hypothetical protein